MKSFYNKTEVVEAIKRYKIIAIIRGVDENKTLDLLTALYDGGIRAAEFAFDNDEQKTYRIIKTAVEQFGKKMYIGAGTVTNDNRLNLAIQAGASYVISPVCDSMLASRCEEAGVCSIIGAFTPTEVKAAMDYRADFVKLFPSNAFGCWYIKSLLAPLDGANIIAFGGVTLDTICDYLNAGAVAVGVGAELIDKRAIAECDFKSIAKKAKSFVDIIKD